MLHKKESLKKLRSLCWAIIVATAGVSIWANVLHAVPRGWTAIVLSALPPLFVLGAFELVSRIPMPREAKWYHRWPRPLATSGVAIGGAWLSYWQQKAAIFNYTGNWQESVVMPLLVDSFMVISSVSALLINTFLRELEAYEQAKQIKAKEPVLSGKPQTSKAPTKKEMVALTLSQNPQLTDAEIAKLTGVSYGYVNTLTKELRSLNGAELVS